MGQEMREVHVTGGKMKGRNELRVNVSKGKPISEMMTGRKEAGKKGTTEKAALGKSTTSGTGCSCLNKIRRRDSQRSQILKAQIKTAQQNQQRTVWKTHLNLVLNVFV